MQRRSVCNRKAQFVQSRVVLTSHLETGELQQWDELRGSILLLMTSDYELVLNKPQKLERQPGTTS